MDRRIRLDCQLIVLMSWLLLAPKAWSQEDAKTPRDATTPTTEQKADSLSALEAKARAFVGRLGNGEFDAATKVFDETMTGALAPTQLESIWSNLQKSTGNFQRIKGIRHESVDVYNIVFVTCEFANASLDMKLVFDSQERISGLFFVPSTTPRAYAAPDYVRPDAFRDQEVTFGAEPWKLPGTLSLPVAESAAPAVVLVHGSGPNDRDETVAANKPFKDLAGGLASRGIAVLRYDKRTRIHAQRIPKDVTVKEETIDDVIAAVDWLSRQPAIDAKRIFVIGHSLGGYLVPRIARADENHQIAGYVIIAGNTRPLEDLIAEQTRYIFGLDGHISASDHEVLEQVDQQVRRVKTLSRDDEPAGEVFGTSASYWLDLDGYRPHQEAATLDFPMLILQGERDYQVTMEDFANWKAALAAREQIRFKSYPALNHLMMRGSGPSQPSEYEKPGHVAAEVIEEIANWVREH